MVKRSLILSLWILLAIIATGLLFIAGKENDKKLCKGINIAVTENAKQVFVDEEGIKIDIQENGGKAGEPVGAIDLKNIETELKKDAWVKDAKLYFDDNQILQVELKENDPLARVFTRNGSSFFIDSAANYLPTNRNVFARVPVFTGFPSDKQKLSLPDSALLQQVKQLAQFISRDSIWMSFVSQINITPNAVFQIVPVVGNSIITIGDAENLPEKFNRLYSFYKQILSRTGINKYDNIDVEFDGQVVASNDTISAKAVQASILSDSLHTKLDANIIQQDTIAEDANVDTSMNNIILDTLPKATRVSPNPSESHNVRSYLQNKKKKLIHHNTTKKP